MIVFVCFSIFQFQPQALVADIAISLFTRRLFIAWSALILIENNLFDHSVWRKIVIQIQLYETLCGNITELLKNYFCSVVGENSEYKQILEYITPKHQTISTSIDISQINTNNLLWEFNVLERQCNGLARSYYLKHHLKFIMKKCFKGFTVIVNKKITILGSLSVPILSSNPFPRSKFCSSIKFSPNAIVTSCFLKYYTT